MVDIGVVIVAPDIFRPWIGTGRLVIEKQDIRFDALRVENSRWQT